MMEVAKAYQTIYDTFKKASLDEVLNGTMDPTGAEKTRSF